jgi:hypothetical protein
MPTKIEIEALATELSKRLADQGRLIEAGWVMFRALTVHPDAPQIQLDEMRYAFMAGAEHLFSSIIGMLDPDEDPSQNDLERMYKIDNELEVYRKEMELRYNKPQGSA